MTDLSPNSSILPLPLFDFVDRITELDRFIALLEQPLASRRERILIYLGPKRIGKTLLLDRLKHECSLRDISVARISFEGGMYNNYLRIMRTIRDHLGAVAFADWTQLVNYYYSLPTKADVTFHVESQPGQGRVDVQAQEMTVGGDIVGRDKNDIHDNFIVVPRHDIDPTLIRDTLSDKFIQALEQFVQEKPAVLLFDSVDDSEFDHLTQQWLWQCLIEPVSKLQGFGVVPVLTLINRPQLERALEVFTKQSQLKPLSREYIEEYLRRRDVPPELVPGAAMMILAQTGGSPGQVFDATESFLNLIAEQD